MIDGLVGGAGENVSALSRPQDLPVFQREAARLSESGGSAIIQKGKGGFMMPNEVRFVRLQCLETEDNGNDEIYMHYNGSHLYPQGADTADIATGQTLPMDMNRRIDGEAIVSLFDEDDIDEDDHLGTIVISESELNQGLRSQTFNGDDANYILFYRVVEGFDD